MTEAIETIGIIIGLWTLASLIFAAIWAWLRRDRNHHPIHEWTDTFWR